jgi:hypothetical protein
VAGIANILKKTLQVDTTQDPIDVPPQQPTTPGGTLIQCPIMGGIQRHGMYAVAWTGGKPNCFWTKLENKTSTMFTPKCLRGTTAKDAINFDG